MPCTPSDRTALGRTRQSAFTPDELEKEQVEQLDLVKCIKTSTDLMKKVVDDVLDFSKYVDGKRTYSFEKINMVLCKCITL